MRTRPGTEISPEKTYNTGFDKLYADMVAAFDGRDFMTFPESVQSRVQNEVIANRISSIVSSVIPAIKPSEIKSRYYRAIRCVNGNVACEQMPGNSFVFEIDSKGRLVAGSGIPLEVVEHFSKTA